LTYSVYLMTYLVGYWCV